MPHRVYQVHFLRHVVGWWVAWAQGQCRQDEPEKASAVMQMTYEVWFKCVCVARLCYFAPPVSQVGGWGHSMDACSLVHMASHPWDKQRFPTMHAPPLLRVLAWHSPHLEYSPGGNRSINAYASGCLVARAAISTSGFQWHHLFACQLLFLCIPDKPLGAVSHLSTAVIIVPMFSLRNKHT